MKKLLLISLIAATLMCIVACSKPEHDWNTFSYTVSSGETLWEIAEEYRPENMDVREYIYEVKELNNMQTDNLAVGQTITLFTTETDYIDMYDVADIQENDGLFTITLSDGNYYEWSKGDLK